MYGEAVSVTAERHTEGQADRLVPGDAVPVYSGTAAAQAAGVSYRRVDLWTTTGRLSPLVPASGSGSARGFTVDEVVRLALVGVMTDEGIGVDLAFACLDDDRRGAALRLCRCDPELVERRVEYVLGGLEPIGWVRP